MMDEGIFYDQHEAVCRGTEIKFKVDMRSNGFDMDMDDWDVTVTCGRESVKVEKRGIWSESYEFPDGLSREDDAWYVYVETDGMKPGVVKVTAVAYVGDPHAHGGIRQEVAVTDLCNLVNP